MRRWNGEGLCPPHPPGPPGRRPGRLRRGAAALVVLGATAGLAAVVLRARADGDRRSPSVPPASAVGVRGEAVDGTIWRIQPWTSRPAVIICVTWTCPHCRVELRRWGRLLEKGRVASGIDVRVVADGPVPAGYPLPDVLRDRVLVDREGMTARTLRAPVVPTTAYVAPGGDVVRLVRGRTPPERMRASLDHLQEISTDDTNF